MADVAERRFVTIDGRAIRMISEQPGGAIYGRQGPQVAVLGGPNQVDTPVPKLHKLAGIEFWVQQHVGQQFHGERTVVSQELTGDRDVFEAPRRAQCSPGAVHSVGKSGRVAVSGALFEHLGKQTREPGFAVGIGDGATTNQRRDADQRHVGLLEKNEYCAILEFDDLGFRQHSILAEGQAMRKEHAQCKKPPHSSFSSGALRTPTVMLLARNTSAAVSRTSLAATISIRPGKRNNAS